jgi:hypothetical protein
MKNLFLRYISIIILLTGFIPHYLFCQERTTDYFIAPEKTALRFISCREGNLTGEIIPGVSTLAKSDIAYPYIAILDTAGNQVLIFNHKEGLNMPYKTITNPNPFIKWGAIKFLQDSIIATGHMADSAKLSVINIKSNETTTYKGPDNIFSFKGIDEILVDGSTLWAVDDLVMPLYILEYRIANQHKLTLVKTHPLKPNGTYESIIQAVTHESYIACLSKTGGGYGSYYPYYITFVKKSSPTLSATYEGGGYTKTFKIKGSKEKYKGKIPYRITSITNNSEHLFYTKPEIGLGIISFESLSPTGTEDWNTAISSSMVKEIPMKDLVKAIWLPNNGVLAGVFKQKGIFEVRIINY